MSEEKQPGIWGRNPVLWLALIRALVVGVTAFGLKLSAEQVAAIYLGAESVLSFVARQQVMPMARVTQKLEEATNAD